MFDFSFIFRSKNHQNLDLEQERVAGFWRLAHLATVRPKNDVCSLLGLKLHTQLGMSPNTQWCPNLKIISVKKWSFMHALFNFGTFPVWRMLCIVSPTSELNFFLNLERGGAESATARVHQVSKQFCITFMFKTIMLIVKQASCKQLRYSWWPFLGSLRGHRTCKEWQWWHLQSGLCPATKLNVFVSSSRQPMLGFAAVSHGIHKGFT